MKLRLTLVFGSSAAILFFAKWLRSYRTEIENSVDDRAGDLNRSVDLIESLFEVCNLGDQRATIRLICSSRVRVKVNDSRLVWKTVT